METTNQWFTSSRKMMIQGEVSRPVLHWVRKFLVQVIMTPSSKGQKCTCVYVWDTDTVISGVVRQVRSMPLKVVLNLRSKNPSFKVLPVLDNAPGNPQDFGLADLSFCPKLQPHACSHSTRELSHLRGTTYYTSCTFLSILDASEIFCTVR